MRSCVLLIAFIPGCASGQSQEDSPHHDIQKRIEDLGGLVDVHSESDVNERRLAGVKTGMISGIMLRNRDLASVDIAAVIPIESVEVLDLIGCSHVNQHADHFSQCRHLRILYMDATDFNDVSLNKVALLPALEELRLVRCDISDAGIAALKESKRLKRLLIGDTHVTKEGVVRVRPAVGIYWSTVPSEEVRLALAALQRAGAYIGSPPENSLAERTLKGLHRYTIILTEKWQDQPEAIQWIATVAAGAATCVQFNVRAPKVLASLERVDGVSTISFNELSSDTVWNDDHVAVLRNAKQLNRLGLFSKHVSATGLQHVAGIAGLKELELYALPFRADMFDALGACKTLQKLSVSSGRLDKNCLAAVGRIESLKELAFGSGASGITSAMVDSLKASRPDLKISMTEDVKKRLKQSQE